MSLHRNKARTVALAGGLIAIMVGLVIYSPTLYRLFCAATGYGGAVQRSLEVEAAEAGPPIHIRMDSNVAPGLNWQFWPEQRELDTRVGVPTKIYYDAKNLSDKTVIARAVYNVTPYKAGPYFFKTECFCFTEEKLGPGESARMPVVFYVDEGLLKNPDTADVATITLSYTFFAQKGADADAVATARDMQAGSQDEDAALQKDGSAAFSSEVHRR